MASRRRSREGSHSSESSRKRPRALVSTIQGWPTPCFIDQTALANYVYDPSALRIQNDAASPFVVGYRLDDPFWIDLQRLSLVDQLPIEYLEALAFKYNVNAYAVIELGYTATEPAAIKRVLRHLQTLVCVQLPVLIGEPYDYTDYPEIKHAMTVYSSQLNLGSHIQDSNARTHYFRNEVTKILRADPVWKGELDEKMFSVFLHGGKSAVRKMQDEPRHSTRAPRPIAKKPVPAPSFAPTHAPAPTRDPRTRQLPIAYRPLEERTPIAQIVELPSEEISVKVEEVEVIDLSSSPEVSPDSPADPSASTTQPVSAEISPSTVNSSTPSAADSSTQVDAQPIVNSVESPVSPDHAPDEAESTLPATEPARTSSVTSQCSPVAPSQASPQPSDDLLSTFSKFLDASLSQKCYAVFSKQGITSEQIDFEFGEFLASPDCEWGDVQPLERFKVKKRLRAWLEEQVNKQKVKLENEIL